jgi:mono/diheme cytochrome c family protein
LRRADWPVPRWGAAVLRPYGIACAICFAATLNLIPCAEILARETESVHQAQEPATTTRSVWDGVYTQEQAKRGEELYRKECASCHGDTLIGGGGASPLAGGAFLSNWNGLTVGDLFDRIRKTMPQGSPGKLTKQQDADILAYLLSFNKFPAGKTELQKQVEFLKEIRFEATKPEAK